MRTKYYAIHLAATFIKRSKSPPFLKGDLGGFLRGYDKSPLTPPLKKGGILAPFALENMSENITLIARHDTTFQDAFSEFALPG